jgi:magnesium transporter
MNNTVFQTLNQLYTNKQIDQLKAALQSISTHELIDVVERFDLSAQVTLLRLMAKDKALALFEWMDVHHQQALLQSFSDEAAMDYFSALEPDDRLRLMDELPAGIAKRLLSALSPEEYALTALLMGYEPNTAGHIMTPKYIRLDITMKVSQALDKVRRVGPQLETINHLYVTDEQRRLEGMIALSDLILASPERSVVELMNAHKISVRTDARDTQVAKLLQDTDLIAVPVVDFEGRLVGVVTIDDALDVLAEDALDAVFDKVGFVELNQRESDRSQVLINGRLVDIWRVRIPFLIITLIGGLMAGGLIAFFEETLEAIVAVAFFVPVVMDMGGNVGTQSSTIFTRALVLGQIDFKAFVRHWLREVWVGASMGLILGALGGALAWLWQGSVELSGVVAIALAFTIVIATALGFLVPYVLVKLGLDQAAGSDPIITTIKDISGLAIYFALVQAFLMG